MKEVDLKHFIGKELGTVTILREIGRGAMGAVFLGFQRTLKRQVAVKVLPELGKTGGVSREQFRHEAELVAVLTHPNIIPIFEMGETDDCCFQVIQLVKGKDVESILRARQRNPLPSRRVLPAAETIDIIISVLDGLDYAHTEEVVHQDIKPSNILIDDAQRRPLIADFGIAKSIEGEITEEGIVFGSPIYMAPERVDNADCDHRVDIYSTGIMLFKLLAGTLPLAERNMMSLLFKKSKGYSAVFTRFPSETSNHIDQDMENIILRAIAVRPNERYQRCSEFRDDLTNYKNSMSA